jgi:hypothetical protein
MGAEAPAARIVLAFPDVATYHHLARRVVAPLVAAGIELWLIGEQGTVTDVRSSGP